MADIYLKSETLFMPLAGTAGGLAEKWERVPAWCLAFFSA